MYPRVTLFHCGQNLERITCPHCAAMISGAGWPEGLDELAGADVWDGADVNVPLRAAWRTQDDRARALLYERPVGFGRFAGHFWRRAPWPDDPTVPAMARSGAI